MGLTFPLTVFVTSLESLSPRLCCQQALIWVRSWQVPAKDNRLLIKVWRARSQEAASWWVVFFFFLNTGISSNCPINNKCVLHRGNWSLIFSSAGISCNIKVVMGFFFNTLKNYCYCVFLVWGSWFYYSDAECDLITWSLYANTLRAKFSLYLTLELM